MSKRGPLTSFANSITAGRRPALRDAIAAMALGGASILGARGSYLGAIAGAVLLATMTALIIASTPRWDGVA